jgi:hypothetical protein
MSLFVIFQEDFKYAVLPPSADLWFESITAALLVTFMVEIGERIGRGGVQDQGGISLHATWGWGWGGEQHTMLVIAGKSSNSEDGCSKLHRQSVKIKS